MSSEISTLEKKLRCVELDRSQIGVFDIALMVPHMRMMTMTSVQDTFSQQGIKPRSDESSFDPLL